MVAVLIFHSESTLTRRTLDMHGCDILELHMAQVFGRLENIRSKTVPIRYPASCLSVY